MSVINTNINALAAQGSMSNVNKKLSVSMERLSTGLRINSAKDDAAGLAITNRMTSQIRGYAMAIRNSNDGISMTQTAEGALGQIGDILQRMRELSVQSSNGSNSAENRTAIQAEVTQLKAEINNIAKKTNHNDIKLLDGSAGDIVLQTGVNSGDTMSMKFDSAQAKDLGIGTPLALTSLGGTAASTTSAISRGDLLINGVLVDQSIAQDDVLSSASNSASAISKAAAINKVSNLTGVVASVNETKVYGTAMDTTAAASGTITINGVATATLATGATASTSTVRGMVIDAINAISAQTGVVASDGGDDNHGVVLTAADGRNIAIAFSGTGFNEALTGVRAAGTYVGTYSLTSVDGSDIQLSAQVGGTIANADLKAGTYQANTAQFVSGYRTPNAISAGVAPAPTALGGDDLIINGVTVGAAVSGDDKATFETTTSATKVSSAIATAAAINRVKDLTGVTAKANANVLVGTGFDAGSTTTTITATSIFLNGVTITANVTSDTTRADLANLINLKAGQTGVVASDNGSGLTLVAEDGRTISLGTSNSGAAGTAAVAGAAIGMATVNGVAALASTSATTAGSIAFIASVTLQSDKTFTVESGSSGNSDFGTLGFVQGTYGGSSDMLNVEHLDVSTQSGAMVAISAIDSAINQVSMQQARAGAYQNRLDAVVNNLTESNQNMSASRSRILDTDYAQETTSLAKSQIIQQAATAMLAQANQSGQSVLALLK
jgi:flagellin